MTEGFLSQDEINALLNGEIENEEKKENTTLTDIEKDLLGEIGNISMGTASTALSQIINCKVNITTPVVTSTTFEDLREEFDIPNLALNIKYISGIVGQNLLVMKIKDSGVIANLMMGGDGRVEVSELTEIEISAVQEAMNQMIGSAATSMATMLGREVNISPPVSEVWNNTEEAVKSGIELEKEIVKVSFRITIGDLVDSNIMQIYPVETAKYICSIMMGEEEKSQNNDIKATPEYLEEKVEFKSPVHEEFIENPTPVSVQKASFQPLREIPRENLPNNIDLIMDVNLDISVVLGRTKKTIKDILALGNGSLIELDRLAEEPVEILVNGKRIAYGEVVVVDENFGVRITSIVSGEDRIKSLSK
ncbi:Flagellar motor switch protein FliN [Clostridium bornimense]|uniref:Flagellar motor switch protein FliN n=1 Tax=Clostridium bornimense TaxID=1216932 RepID=W6RYJ9_9CLOT|nr:flagellar motor switch phosphatase FliY [Clostridium bornimense]CDM68699.1 Flagellar motor switch protein FliN [Clostridium bornimense]